MIYLILMFVVLGIGLPLYWYSRKKESTKLELANSLFWVVISIVYIVLYVYENDTFFTVLWSYILVLNFLSTIVNSAKLYKEVKESNQE